MAVTIRAIAVPVVLLAAATAVAAFLIVNRPPPDLSEPPVSVVTVDVALVEKEDLRIPIAAQGTVNPLRATRLVSEVQGRVLEVAPAFISGGFVAADDILLRLDDRDYRAALLRSEAAVKTAESAMSQERGRADVAAREWAKLPAGSQRSEQARDLYLRKPQLAQAEAQLLSARADLASAQDDLDRTEIRAPYDALVRSRAVELGQYLSPGTEVGELFSIEVAEVRLAVSQGKLPYLDLPNVTGSAAGGNSAGVELFSNSSGQVRRWPAVLHRTEGVFDERSRVLFLVARVNDPYAVLTGSTREPLRVGSFVQARIEGSLQSDIVVLPRRAVRAGNLVWIIDNKQRLRSRAVSILPVGGDEVFVTAGLDSGERVSLTALDATFDGAEVEILSERSTRRRDGAQTLELPTAADESTDNGVAAG